MFIAIISAPRSDLNKYHMFVYMNEIQRPFLTAFCFFCCRTLIANKGNSSHLNWILLRQTKASKYSRSSANIQTIGLFLCFHNPIVILIIFCIFLKNEFQHMFRMCLWVSIKKYFIVWSK